MLTATAHAVLRALRDLADESGAALTGEQTKRRDWTASPAMAKLSARSGVPSGKLEDVLFELKADGLVTTVCGRPVVTLLGRQHLADAAAPADEVAAC